MRDISNYTDNYYRYKFEEQQVLYRRKQILEIMERYSPGSVLEIGCGSEPLFRYYNCKYTIVEPSLDFANHAKSLITNDMEVSVINDFFENVAENFYDEHFDMIVCSALLHEVLDPINLMKCIYRVADEDTITHINVPNAYSIHRILAYEAGLIDDLEQLSESNVRFQQGRVFSKESLKHMAINVGFYIVDAGSYFVKPFTHRQMLFLLESGMIDEKILQGLYKLIKYIPEYGSEIYVNMRKVVNE